jgi:hypothetical protein
MHSIWMMLNESGLSLREPHQRPHRRHHREPDFR